MPSFSTHENSHGDLAVIAVLKSAKIIEDPSSICAGFHLSESNMVTDQTKFAYKGTRATASAFQNINTREKRLAISSSTGAATTTQSSMENQNEHPL